MTERLTEEILAEEKANRRLLFPDNPSKFREEHLDRILEFALQNNASDIFIKTNTRIRAQIYGKNWSLTPRNIDSDEFNAFVNKIYGPTAISILNTGIPIDTTHVIENKEKNVFSRFRVSMKSCLVTNGDGYTITLRPIPETPPDLDPEIPLEVVEAFNRKQGLNLVIGATGSGKSTLIASIIKRKLLDPNCNAHIISYEAPIEFVYTRIPQIYSFIDQVEIGKHLKTFPMGIENALRNAPTDIFIGEMRDAASITGGLNVCDMGHLVYSTMHVNGVAYVLTRAISNFPTEEKAAATIGMISNFNLILYQRLIPTIDGKRTAVREYLLFDENIKNEIMNSGSIELMPRKLKDMLWKYGYPYVVHLRQRYLEGKISYQTYSTMKMENSTKSDEELDEIIKKHKANGHIMFQNNNL